MLLSYFYIATAPQKWWEEDCIPFLYDPIGYCSTNKKVKPYWEFLQKCLVTPIEDGKELVQV